MIRGHHAVVLVYGTSHAIRAEQVLFRAGIASKLIPVPRHLSSNCGVCLRILQADREAALEALEEAAVQIEGIHDID
jgi:hypothetical protein